jgi:MFS family permease
MLTGWSEQITAIASDVHAGSRQPWIVNVTTLCQAALGPLVASVSDLFQVRKPILILATVLGLIGSAIAPGSKDVYRLIGAQILIGFALVAAPLSYSVPSEIMPRRYRPATQGLVNAWGSIGSVVAPLVYSIHTHGNVSLIDALIRSWEVCFDRIPLAGEHSM